MKLGFVIILLAITCGCARLSIPIYPKMRPAESLAIASQNYQQIQSVQAKGTITLSDTKKESVRLDGVLILQRPDKLRLRAWKLGQVVFDLTINDIAAYQYIPRNEAKSAITTSHKLLSHWQRSLLGNLQPDPETVTESNDQILFRNVQQDHEEWTIDRKTLTVSQIQIEDENGERKFELQFRDYQAFNTHVWPTLIRAIRESGVIEIKLSEIEINGQLPENAFVPPARAERLP